MFRTLLIANRGEIACRIVRTARRMGLRTVAVYSDADANALHVQMADAAVAIGAAPARDSYLNISRVIDAARRSGADSYIRVTDFCRKTQPLQRRAPPPG